MTDTLKSIRRETMTHYRVTRPEAYSQNTPGFKDVSARQGHYVNAETAREAAREIRKRLEITEPLDVQCWDGSEDHGLVVLYETR
jgi:hypothetical protein